MKITILIISAIFSLGLFAQYKISKSTNETEKPNYKLVKKFETFEIRKYPKLLLASTSVNSDNYKGKSNNGFRTIAAYIFGGNNEQEAISMTSPVLMTVGDSEEMSFIMPSKYSLENIPTPNDSNVILNYQPEKTVAVISFGGFANDKKIELYTIALKGLLKKENITHNEEIVFQGYNPPFEFFNRHNEIAITVLNYE